MSLLDQKVRAIMSVTCAIESESSSILEMGRHATATMMPALDTAVFMTLVPDAPAHKARATRLQSRTTSVFIREDMIGGRVIGLLHSHDVLRDGVA